MKREDIEKAAVEFANDKCQKRGCPKTYRLHFDFDRYDIEQSFETGASWRINSVWHDTKTEVPDINAIVLVEKEDGSIWQYKVFAKSQMMGWKRWAYIKDLIPNE